MTNISVDKIANLPKPVLDKVASQAQMPHQAEASREEIAEWLIVNQPSTAQKLVAGDLSGGIL